MNSESNNDIFEGEIVSSHAGPPDPSKKNVVEISIQDPILDLTKEGLESEKILDLTHIEDLEKMEKVREELRNMGRS